MKAWAGTIVSMMGVVVLGIAAQARAQVLEIGEGGKVKVFDRPTVFTADGATPIESRRLRAIPAAEAAPGLAHAAEGAALSPDLIEAVAWQESHLKAGAVSRAGAIGEMQLMPATARGLGVDPWDARDNLRGGAAYLGALLQRYDNNLVDALAAYNAGPGAVDRYGGVPPYAETRAYVDAIMNRLSARAVEGMVRSER